MAYIPKPIDTSKVKLSRDLSGLVELLAEHNHDIWAQGRMKESWTYGPQRDDTKKTHPDLMPYGKLPESEKEYDRKSSMEIVKAIITLRRRVVKLVDFCIFWFTGRIYIMDTLLT